MLLLILAIIIMLGWGVYCFVWQCELEDKQELLEKQEAALRERWEWYRAAMNDIINKGNDTEQQS